MTLELEWTNEKKAMPTSFTIFGSQQMNSVQLNYKIKMDENIELQKNRTDRIN